jgi:hypothetical protein
LGCQESSLFEIGRGIPVVWMRRKLVDFQRSSHTLFGEFELLSAIAGPSGEESSAIPRSIKNSSEKVLVNFSGRGETNLTKSPQDFGWTIRDVREANDKRYCPEFARFCFPVPSSRRVIPRTNVETDDRLHSFGRFGNNN